MVAEFAGLLADLAAEATSRLGAMEGAAFCERLRLVLPDLREATRSVYGTDADVDALVQDLVRDALAATEARPMALRMLDRRREVDPRWFLAQDVVGYVCYVDRFAGSLAGLADRLDYLEQLGVRYLHLMPLLRSRDGENDGGYAVTDYDDVDPRLGTMADLESLADVVHQRGIALCVDLVLNHTAREHPWALGAAAGDPELRARYRIFPDRSQPDAFEATLPEVFPDLAPGSFSPLPGTAEWVWTTFHDYQWDLDWSRPEVFRLMAGVLFGLANHGVDVVRLDAVPFLWKRLGTNCQDQPETHRLLQMLKALTRLAMPGVVLKAEAIVGPDLLTQYLGAHDPYRPECDLAYDNQLMVMLWSSVATRDTRLAGHALQRRGAAPAGTGWVTYVRCHDDIGWAVSDEDARAVGLDPWGHRSFLASFFSGGHEGSFASGRDFQRESSGSARTSGMTASLAGLDRALAAGSDAAVAAALARIELLYSVIYSYGGIPLVYMGDEVGLGNDVEWATDPAHAADNRWLHRPPMDWALASRRTDPASVPGRLFSALQRLGRARASTEALRSDAATTVFHVDNPHVLGYVRRHPRAEPVLVLANFSDRAEWVGGPVTQWAGLADPVHLHSSRGGWEPSGDGIELQPWGYLWISSRPS